ncbi:hypothetical protein TWF506_008825 [Arthrobotrys conoides]|uniref:Uncharacterized protein n=1 Tax=Arthrobotrys conoides TaxID=74498 RepID=A0AAN8NJQ0_9PEZI
MLKSILLSTCLILPGTFALTVPNPLAERGLDPADYGLTARQLREHLFPRAGISTDGTISCEGGEPITSEDGIVLGCSFHLDHQAITRAVSTLAPGTSPNVSTRSLGLLKDEFSSKLSKRAFSGYLSSCYQSGIWAKQSELILANQRMAPGYGKYGGTTLSVGYTEQNTLWRNVNGQDIKGTDGITNIQVDYTFSIVGSTGSIPSSWTNAYVLSQLNRIVTSVCIGQNSDSRGGGLTLKDGNCYISIKVDPNER